MIVSAKVEHKATSGKLRCLGAIIVDVLHTSLRNLMKKLTRDRVVPIISTASLATSWDVTREDRPALHSARGVVECAPSVSRWS